MKKLLLSALLASSASMVSAEIRQELGVDPRVDYRALEALGPWDDRNYQLTKEDLEVLPENDHYLHNVPLFFKIEKRRMEPNIDKFYPRSTLQHFQMDHGGLIVDGIWYKDGLGVNNQPDPAKAGDEVAKGNGYGKVGGVEIKGVVVSPLAESPLEEGVSGNEVTVECNPTNGLLCVAGSNAAGGQRMYYSQDGGLTWTFSQINENSSCCDPTMDYSADGSIVYQGDLRRAGGIGVRWSRSLDQGVTWEPMQDITTTGSDKEWIHVDRSATSPHVDNIYMTWHDGNVMQFARSTDMGLSFSTPLSFTAEERGIGSDIATDSAGTVYYVYPGLAGGGIRLLRSTDGGATFGASSQIAPLNGIFDFPVPSMESREVFIYVSVDVDSNDNIYVAFTDEADDSAGNGGGSAANNRAVIKIAKSTDGGDTWSLITAPHANDGELASGNPIDRYHPWISIGENDALHVGFYDTRNSTNRTGVDFYYNVSLDGGMTWLPEGEQRYSTETSANINNGQEWGDYNGISVVLDRLVMSWTDNRPSIGQSAMIGAGDNQFSNPTFLLAAGSSALNVCGGDMGTQVNIDVNGLQGYAENVTLSISGSSTVTNNEAFSVNPVVPGNSSVLSFDVLAGQATGEYVLTVQGEGDEVTTGTNGGNTITRDIPINLSYSAGVPAGSALTAPADMATDVALMPTLMWDVDANANTYLVEIATDMMFANIVMTETVDTNSYTPGSDLPSSTELFWRVTGQSACGMTSSAVSSFTTVPLPGDCAIGQAQVDVVNYNFELTDLIYANGFEAPTAIDGEVVERGTIQGWTTEALQGAATWTLQSGIVNSGTQAFNSPDLDNTSDNVLTSPVISVPTGSGPYTLRFWNQQSMESRGAGGCWDGGVLEISQNGGPFVQVATDKMINDPYDGALNAGPLNGSDAWCGDPQDGQVNSVDINDFAGSDIQVRFRIVTDGSVGRPEGWTIDDVRVTGCAIPPSPQQ